MSAMMSTIQALLVVTLSSFGAAQTSFRTPQFAVQLTSNSGVLQSLVDVQSSFDFAPSDVFANRTLPGQYHTGDLTIRYRSANATTWQSADTAAQRNNVSSLDANGSITTSLNDALPSVGQYLNVTRSWSGVDGDLLLQFTIANVYGKAVEIGSLGMPIEMNNIFTGRTAVETTAKCVLVDPFIGNHGGYVQATRLTGTGPNLVITPYGDTTKLEAWRFLSEPKNVPLGYQVQTYEGNYEWQAFSKAYAEQEWNATTPWNSPTSALIQPGAAITVGLRFSVAPTLPNIESTVATMGQPAVIGIPGYVLPYDLIGSLFINSTENFTEIASTPPGAVTILPGDVLNGTWQSFKVTPSNTTFGRVRVDMTYGNNKTLSIHYWLTKSGPTALAELGSFLTTEQWYDDKTDPFHRAPSVITYNHDNSSLVLHDNRTWIAGLSDEGGAGSFLAAALKQTAQPSAAEVTKLERMVHETVWGDLQISSGNETYGVRKSLFFYEPALVPGYDYSAEFNWTVNPGESWNRAAAYLLNRAYDYVHVSALYWSLYHVGRTQSGLLTQATPDWYLLQAYNTVMFVFGNSTTDGERNTAYWDLGLMGEWTWGHLLADLRAENHTAEADAMEAQMAYRQQLWAARPDPFGSEMAWDSTGQEGVYYWSKYFNDTSTAQKTIESIRGYMPTIPHWGYNGNARRYWDFLYAGEIHTARIERQIHHYGSGLNALPMLDNYRSSPDPQSLEAIYDLRVGYGGNQGPLTNIHEDGFGAMAFHSYADTLRWDAYSGDFGPNFLGHVFGAATYLVEHPIFGWVSFGGDVLVDGASGMVTVQPRDAVRKRVFIAPLSLYITIDTGTILTVTYDKAKGEVVVTVLDDRAQNESGNSTYGANDGQRVNLGCRVTAGKRAISHVGAGGSQGRGEMKIPLDGSGRATMKVS